MSSSRFQTDAPQVYLFSTDPLLVDDFAAQIAAFGLKPLIKSPQIISSLDQNHLVVWLITDLLAQIRTIINTLSQPDCRPSKALIVFPIDKPQSSVADVDSEIREINDYINQIIDICRHQQIDVRFVAHHSLFSRDKVGEGSGLSAIATLLQNGKLPYLDRQPLFPTFVDELVPQILAVWFDRGHRYQKILIHGPSLTPSDFNTLVGQLNSQFPLTPLDHYWSSGEGINPDDKIDIKTDISILFNTLRSYIVSPPPQPVSPPPSPPPVSQTPPPVSLSPSPPPTISRPPKTIKPLVRPPSIRPLYLKIISISLIAAAIAYLFVTYGLLFFTLFNLKRFNPQAQAQLDSALNRLDAAHYRYLKLSLIHTFDDYFSHQHQSVYRHLLNQAAQTHAINALSITLGNQAGDPYAELSQAKLILDQLYAIESRLPSPSTSTLTTLESLRQLLTVYPQIFPPNKKLTILLLLQNNLELRPTGGFIGSVGLVTLDNGKILNVDTRNIYDLDSNLHGQVPPPAEVTQYLGESSWYFRDSNWYPDFISSAKSASWFLSKEWGSPADVVIGVNLNTFRTILTQIGNLTLSNGAIVNADNLLISALNSQESINATSAQPEYLSLLLSALLYQLNQANTATKLNILSGIYQAIKQGEITLSSNQPQLNPILSDLLLNGTLYSPACSPVLPSPCFADHYYLNQANVGINKANYYVTRHDSYQVALNGASIVHTHTINLENTSPNTTWPAGSYKAYYRAFLPDTASQIQVIINNQPLSADQLSFLSISGHRQVAWYYQLEPQSQASIVISYQLPQPANLKSYQLFVQKQPGQLPTKYSVNITGSTTPLLDSGTATSHLFFPLKFFP